MIDQHTGRDVLWAAAIASDHNIYSIGIVTSSTYTSGIALIQVAIALIIMPMAWHLYQWSRPYWWHSVTTSGTGTVLIPIA